MPSGSRRTRKKRAARRRGEAVPPKAPAPATVAAPREAAPQADPRPRTRRPVAEEAPKPPWGSFPLVALAVLAGIILRGVGFLVASGDTQPVLVVLGLLLCSVAGLEVAVREHVTGYRSHTLILSGVP